MDPQKRKLSTGTILMLIATVLVLAAAAFVLARLSSGAPADLTNIRPETVVHADHLQRETEQPHETVPVPATAEPAGIQEAEPTEQPVKSFTLTVGGTVCLAGEVRTNSYYSDVKQYDYYDTMTLLRKNLQGDLNAVFLENILSTDQKASDVIAAGAAVSMLKAAGINAAACGFAKAFDKGEDGIRSTRRLLAEYGIQPVGIYENDGNDGTQMLEINGIRTALLEYTDTIQAGTRKNMERNGQNGMIPPASAEEIRKEIAEIRERGCDAVIVLVQWGKTGKAPDRNQKALAQKIADAGADLIIGCGSRIVSGAETLTAAEYWPFPTYGDLLFGV